jgi:hypothetical protein
VPGGIYDISSNANVYRSIDATCIYESTTGDNTHDGELPCLGI